MILKEGFLNQIIERAIDSCIKDSCIKVMPAPLARVGLSLPCPTRGFAISDTPRTLLKELYKSDPGTNLSPNRWTYFRARPYASFTRPLVIASTYNLASADRQYLSSLSNPAAICLVEPQGRRTSPWEGNKLRCVDRIPKRVSHIIDERLKTIGGRFLHHHGRIVATGDGSS